MKKILSILIVGIFVLSGLGAFALDSNVKIEENLIEKTIVFSEPLIKEGEQYLEINLEEQTSSILEVGKPKLPVVSQVFTFPFGTKIDSVEVSFSNENKLFLSKEIEPVPEPVKMNSEKISIKNSIKDLDVYESKVLYPKNSYNFNIASGLKDNNNVVYVLVYLYPIRYCPAENVIYYSENANVKVSFEDPEKPLNFNDVYDLVIIAPSKFSDELQPLIDHKINYGVETTLKTTEDIYDEYTGFDEAEEIKLFIKDAIENWGADYILLFGSVDILPIRTTWFYQQWHQHWWNESVLTDLYYADIYDEFGDFCSWDSNGNGLYGESYRNCPGENDTVDLYPDVNVGRLACTYTKDANTVVDKIIYYEKNTYGTDWFNNIVLVGGDTFPDHNGNEGELLNDMIEDIMSDFIAKKLWTSDNTFSALKLNIALYFGAGFFDYSGHGLHDRILTHPPNSEEWVLYHNHNLKHIYNGNKLPIVFFDACLTAKLDNNESTPLNIPYTPKIINNFFVNNKIFSKIFNFFVNNFKTNHIFDILNKNEVTYEQQDNSELIPCFAWRWLIEENGGAIGTIGSTRTAFGGFDSGAGKMSIEFFSSYESSEKLGEMMTQAQFGYITDVPYDLFTVEEFILLGDPSLEIGGYP